MPWPGFWLERFSSEKRLRLGLRLLDQPICVFIRDHGSDDAGACLPATRYQLIRADCDADAIVRVVAHRASSAATSPAVVSMILTHRAMDYSRAALWNLAPVSRSRINPTFPDWRWPLREIVTDFDADPAHLVWFFGEALHRALREGNLASISLDQVDRAVDQLRVAVRSKRRVTRTVHLIEKLLAQNLLAGRARISEIVPPS